LKQYTYLLVIIHSFGHGANHAALKKCGGKADVPPMDSLLPSVAVQVFLGEARFGNLMVREPVRKLTAKMCQQTAPADMCLHWLSPNSEVSLLDNK
jgi:hypothetical protein